MKYSKAIIIFLLAFLCQGSLLNLFSILGATPNLILCLVVIFSFLYEGKNYGMVLGVVFGLLTDICYMQYVGVSALGYFLVAFSIVLLRELVNKENIASILLTTALVTLIFNIFVWLAYAILDSNIRFGYMIKYQPIYIAYNLVVVLILYQVVIRRVIKHRRDRYYI